MQLFVGFVIMTQGHIFVKISSSGSYGTSLQFDCGISLNIFRGEIDVISTNVSFSFQL